MNASLTRCTRWLIPVLTAAYSLTTSAEPVPDTCEIHYPSDAGIAWTCHRIRPQDALTGLFGSHWRDVLRFNRIDRRHIYPGVRIKVPDDLRDVDHFTPVPKTYPPAADKPKFILVDLTEQFLGAYAAGKLVMSFPITSGDNTDAARRTPDGLFKVTAYDRLHRSSLYDLPHDGKPYPMHYALRFFITRQGVSVWIHGRDLPGYAASHGCIGLYDEQMQKTFYGYPRQPVLEDARELYDWVIGPHSDDAHFHILPNGPAVLVIGRAPDFLAQSPKHDRKLPSLQTRP